MKARNRWLVAGLALVALAAASAAVLLWGRTHQTKSGVASPAGGDVIDSTSAPPSYAGPSPSVEELRSSVTGANVVICVLDAARPDHFGCHGYPRPTTPNADRLARESLVFTQHYCQIPHTRPSTASLLTSTYPDTHNVFYWRGGLRPSLVSVESVLGAAGWHTAFFSGNVHASAAMRLGTEFHYRPGGQPGAGRGARGGRAPDRHFWETPEQLLEEVSEWLESDPPQPFFAYVHFRHPHVPYDAPAEMQALFSNAAQAAGGADEPRGEERDLYDANLRYADWALGELELLLRQHDVFDNTIFILTSDHGETLGEHEQSKRQWCPYDEVMHIPMIVRFPDTAGLVGSVPALTQTIDLVPTILDLFDLPHQRGALQGQSLLPLLTGEKSAVNDYAFARTDKELKNEPASYVVRDLRWALILRQGGTHRELYDTEADPGQTRDVSAQHPEEVQRMLQAFGTFAVAQARPPLDFIDPEYEPPPVPPSSAVELTEEMRQQLRSLGYLE